MSAGLPPGWNLSSMFRTGGTRYRTRPPANCKAARLAWDFASRDRCIVWMQLLDGHWGVMREDEELEEYENTFRINAALRAKREQTK